MNITVVMTEEEFREFLEWRDARKNDIRNTVIIPWFDSDLRIRNSLLNMKVTTVGQVIGRPAKDFLVQRNFGMKSFRKFIGVMASHGIELVKVPTEPEEIFQLIKK